MTQIADWLLTFGNASENKNFLIQGVFLELYEEGTQFIDTAKPCKTDVKQQYQIRSCKLHQPVKRLTNEL